MARLNYWPEFNLNCFRFDPNSQQELVAILRLNRVTREDTGRINCQQAEAEVVVMAVAILRRRKMRCQCLIFHSSLSPSSLHQPKACHLVDSKANCDSVHSVCSLLGHQLAVKHSIHLLFALLVTLHQTCLTDHRRYKDYLA